MAYTYDDFIKAANDGGMLNSFNKYDLETAKKNPEFGLSVLSLMKDAAGAGTPEAKLLADASINNLRKTYGNYTIGDDGSYVFTSSTDGDLQKLMEQSANYGEFSYDEEKDPLYGSYAKTYLREGDRAFEKVLAQMAAANGGQVSTSALAAAQQAQNYYNGQLADIIPSLRQNAYDEWLTGLDILQTDIGNLQEKKQEEYAEFLDRETLANNAIANALTMYQTLGYATPEVAAVLGLKAGTMYDAPANGNGASGADPVTGNPVVTDPEYYSGNGNLTANQVADVQRSLGVEPDGKWGAISQAAAGGRSAEEAYDLWNRGLLGKSVIDQQGWTANGGGLDFDANNLIALAPMGMNAEQVQKALSGDPQLASQLAVWIDEKVSSGQLIEYEQNGKIKFRWKV